MAGNCRAANGVRNLLNIIFHDFAIFSVPVLLLPIITIIIINSSEVLDAVPLPHPQSAVGPSSFITRIS
jgi:hypothetical protein